MRTWYSVIGACKRSNTVRLEVESKWGTINHIVTSHNIFVAWKSNKLYNKYRIKYVRIPYGRPCLEIRHFSLSDKTNVHKTLDTNMRMWDEDEEDEVGNVRRRTSVSLNILVYFSTARHSDSKNILLLSTMSFYSRNTRSLLCWNIRKKSKRYHPVDFSPARLNYEVSFKMKSVNRTNCSHRKIIWNEAFPISNTTQLSYFSTLNSVNSDGH